MLDARKQLINKCEAAEPNARCVANNRQRFQPRDSTFRLWAKSSFATSTCKEAA